MFSKKKEKTKVEDVNDEDEVFEQQPDAEMTSRLKARLAIVTELERHVQQSKNCLLNWYLLHFPELQKFLYRGHNVSENDEMETKNPNRNTLDNEEQFYSHFQKFEEKENMSINDAQDFFLRLVTQVGFREEFTDENLHQLGLPDDEVEDILLKAKHSEGIPFEQMEADFLKNMSTDILNLKTRQTEIETLIGQDVSKIAPNLSVIAGNLLAAELLADAGGLMCLAKLSPQKVQTLGPNRIPNIGYIIRHNNVRFAPSKGRIQVAQVVASAVVSAVRVDAFRNARKDEKLLTRLKKNIEEVSQAQNKPSTKKTNGAIIPYKPKEPTVLLDALIVSSTAVIGYVCWKYGFLKQ